MRLVLAIAVCALILTPAACSSFGAASTESDAGVDATTPLLDGSSPPPDAQTSETCTVLVSDDLAKQRLDWQTIGNDLRFDPGALFLTPGGESKSGAVWWKKPLTYESFLRVRVDVRFATAASAAKGNGFALSWTSTESALPATIGGLGESFGVCSATPPVDGYAFTGSTANNRVAIVDTAVCNTNPAQDRPPAKLDGDHTFAFELRPTKIVASLDGVVIATRVALSPPATKVGYFGMSAAAANGSFTAHIVKSVLVESCTE